jgi:hypothetical protein
LRVLENALSGRFCAGKRYSRRSRPRRAVSEHIRYISNVGAAEVPIAGRNVAFKILDI